MSDLKKGLNARITGSLKGEIDVKRFYMPGIAIKAQCPYCQEEVETDFESDYLSYPVAGKPIAAHFYHEGKDGEDHEFEVMVTLKVSLELAKEKTRG